MEEEKNEEKQEHEHTHHTPKKTNLTKKLRDNPWILSTIVLGVTVIALLIGSLFGGITGKVVSSNQAGESLVSYLNTIAASEVSLVSVEEENNMYLVTVDFQGEEIPVYVTKDGEAYATSLMPIVSSTPTPNSNNQVTPSAEIPKANKPKVELFIWSYCPYGVQAQGPFAEAALLLKDKLDLEVILYFDGHGEFETQENKIQACIQKLEKDKYWDYASRFPEEVYPKCSSSRDVECDKTEAIKLMNSVGIDSNAVMSCVSTQGEQLLSEHSARAKELGVSGSPTIAVNNVRLSPRSDYCSTADANAGKCIVYPVARNADAYKEAICESFDGTAPAECETTLDSSTTTASGNC